MIITTEYNRLTGSRTITFTPGDQFYSLQELIESTINIMDDAPIISNFILEHLNYETNR